ARVGAEELDDLPALRVAAPGTEPEPPVDVAPAARAERHGRNVLPDPARGNHHPVTGTVPARIRCTFASVPGTAVRRTSKAAASAGTVPAPIRCTFASVPGTDGLRRFGDRRLGAAVGTDLGRQGLLLDPVGVAEEIGLLCGERDDDPVG